MSNLGLHLLHHAAVHFGKHFGHRKRYVCARCNKETTLEKSIQFQCCKSTFCDECADTMLTPLEDKAFLVQCTHCGKRRVTKMSEGER